MSNYTKTSRLSLYADGTIAVDSGVVVATVTDPHEGLGRMIELIPEFIEMVHHCQNHIFNAEGMLWAAKEKLDREGHTTVFAPGAFELCEAQASKLIAQLRIILGKLDQIEKQAAIPRGEPG